MLRGFEDVETELTPCCFVEASFRTGKVTSGSRRGRTLKRRLRVFGIGTAGSASCQLASVHTSAWLQRSFFADKTIPQVGITYLTEATKLEKQREFMLLPGDKFRHVPLVSMQQSKRQLVPAVKRGHFPDLRHPLRRQKSREKKPSPEDVIIRPFSNIDTQ